ncbi:serine/threonine protein kinase [Myxococcota bacterium]
MAEDLPSSPRRSRPKPTVSGSSSSANGFQLQSTERAGTLVGDRYCIQGRLGHGRTSEVFLAIDQRAERRVVIKQLLAHSAMEPGLVGRFARELGIIGRLRHPSIARVFDFATPSGERPYVVMEALVGEPLRELLARDESLSTDVALILSRHAASALLAAHQAGVVHRDIRPSNLFLLGPIGDPVGLKVVDFGMAKLNHWEGTVGRPAVRGTMEYMAPEQVMVDPMDARTDVYALGILMFHLFTGYLPFDAREGLDLLSHQVFSTVPPASWLNEQIDPRLDEVIARATRKNPRNRYPSMARLLDALDDVVGLRELAEPRADSSEWEVDPDVYQPENPKGREVAQLLAQRYQTLAPPAHSTVPSRMPALRVADRGR